MKILNEPPTPIESLVPDLPAQLVAAVNRALAKDPDERFATAGELSKELQWIRRALGSAGEGAPLEETRFATPTEIRKFQSEIGSQDRKSSTGSRAAAAAAPAPAAGTPKWVIPAAAGAVVLVGALVAFLTMGRGSSTTAAAPTPAPVAAAPKSPEAAPAAVDGVALKISSEPTGASIIVDGRDTKQATPASITLKGSGPFKLQLTKRGFASKTVNLEAADVRSGSVNYTLEEVKVVILPIAITSAYPVEVFDGSKSISRPSDSHHLKLPAGTTIRVRNPEYLLDASVRVDGKSRLPGAAARIPARPDALRDVQRQDRRQGPRVSADDGAAGRRPVQGRDRLSRRTESEQPVRHDHAEQRDHCEDPMKRVSPTVRRSAKRDVEAAKRRRRIASALIASLAIAVTVGAQSPREEELARRQYQSGLDFFQNRRYAEALKDFQAVVDSFPKSSVADAALVQIAMYQLDVARNPDAAQAATDKLLKEYPDGAAAPMAYVMAGRLAINKGRAAADVEAALASYERVPRLFPGSEAVGAANYYAGDTLLARAARPTKRSIASAA